MMRKLTAILLTTSMILMSVVTARAGGPFETFDITGAGPSPIPGHMLARVIPIKWDARQSRFHIASITLSIRFPTRWGPDFDCGSGHAGVAGVVRCLEFDPNLIHRYADCWDNEQPGIDPV